MPAGDRQFRIRTQRREAAAVTVGETSFTPVSQAVIIDVPFGQLVWNRPSAVLVHRDGRTRRLPIIDVTRICQVVLYALALGSSVATILMRRH